MNRPFIALCANCDRVVEIRNGVCYGVENTIPGCGSRSWMPRPGQSYTEEIEMRRFEKEIQTADFDSITDSTVN